MTSPETTSTPLVVIAAGGTGGHMFPAQAFADEMKQRGWRVGLITDDRGMRYVDSFPADWIDTIPAATLGSKRPDKLLKAMMNIRGGISLAKRKMKTERPVLAAGFGGYPSFPTLQAANGLKVPIIIHEQNAVLGRVNRVFAKSARFVCSGFKRLDKLPKGAAKHWKVVGNPVRGPILTKRDVPFPHFDTDSPIKILVTGGSQGAKMFGEVVPAAIVGLPEELRTRIRMVQQVREDQIVKIQTQYDNAGIACELAPFFSDMPERLANCHLCIARSGAGTVSELCVVGRPSILIPLGIAMDDHQLANAQAVEATGGADVIPEKEFTSGNLAEVLALRLGPHGELAQRAKSAHSLGQLQAAKDLADLAVGLVN